MTLSLYTADQSDAYSGDEDDDDDLPIENQLLDNSNDDLPVDTQDDDIPIGKIKLQQLHDDKKCSISKSYSTVEILIVFSSEFN